MVNHIKSFQKRKTVVVLIIASLAVIIPICVYLILNTYSSALAAPSITKDPNLKVETVVTGLSSPTSMAFLGPNDILVLEKDQGTVQRIVNGNMLAQPVLKVNVSTDGERGMLGIAILKHTPSAASRSTTSTTFVFLYYTETNGSGSPLGNRVYRYELVDNKLINPKLILNLPATPGPFHNGGKVTDWT
jgi:glucose/arabinose dehydrogenase